MSKKIAIFGSRKYDTCEYHIADSLKHLGYDVRIFDYNNSSKFSKKIGYWLRRFIFSYSSWTCKKVANKVIDYKPDLVIATYRDIHPVFVDTVKEKLNDIMCIHINPDAVTTFQNQQLFASKYDHYFTKDKFIADFMRNKIGFDVHVIPESFNPRVHTRPEKSNEDTDIDVLVFGGMYPYRTKILAKMAEAGIKLTIYGTKGYFFPKSLEPFFHDRQILGPEKAKLMNEAKIVFNNFHYAEIEGVNCKFFEINGSGGFQICDYRPCIDDYLSVDASKVTFNCMDEVIDKVKYFLAPENQTERREIVEKNYQHFMKHHTYENRIKQIFEIIGF